jgi:hypothetical protein
VCDRLQTPCSALLTALQDSSICEAALVVGLVVTCCGCPLSEAKRGSEHYAAAFPVLACCQGYQMPETASRQSHNPPCSIYGLCLPRLFWVSSIQLFRENCFPSIREEGGPCGNINRIEGFSAHFGTECAL